MKTLIILSIFSNIKTWAIGTTLAGFLGLGFIKKKALIVNKIAKFVTKWSNTIAISMQVGSKLLFSVRDTSQKIDDAIADDTGSTNINTLKEALELGKKVKVDLDDMVVIFKPKK